MVISEIVGLAHKSPNISHIQPILFMAFRSMQCQRQYYCGACYYWRNIYDAELEHHLLKPGEVWAQSTDPSSMPTLQRSTAGEDGPEQRHVVGAMAWEPCPGQLTQCWRLLLEVTSCSRPSAPTASPWTSGLSAHTKLFY